VEDSGDDAVDGEFLSVTESQVRHGLVGQVEVCDIIQLNVAQSALSQELYTPPTHSESVSQLVSQWAVSQRHISRNEAVPCR